MILKQGCKLYLCANRGVVPVQFFNFSLWDNRTIEVGYKYIGVNFKTGFIGCNVLERPQLIKAIS